MIIPACFQPASSRRIALLDILLSEPIKQAPAEAKGSAGQWVTAAGVPPGQEHFYEDLKKLFPVVRVPLQRALPTERLAVLFALQIDSNLSHLASSKPPPARLASHFA